MFVKANITRECRDLGGPERLKTFLALVFKPEAKRRTVLFLFMGGRIGQNEDVLRRSQNMTWISELQMFT